MLDEIITDQIGSGDIKIVTPSQASVDQAKASVKRKIEESIGEPIKILKLSKNSQSGSGKSGVKKSKKKSNKKKNKISKKSKKANNKSKSKNKSSKKSKKNKNKK